MATTLTITGWEGGTINLNDGTNYRLGEGWAPLVARRRSEPLAGYSQFLRQQEPIPLRVFGSSATAALGAAHDLAKALDQARRWANGENVNAVILNYKPDGAAGNVLKAALWGGEGDGLTLPPTFNKNIQAFEINPVTLTVLRDGDWLDATESASSPTFINGDKMTATFSGGAVEVDSPVELRVNYENYGTFAFSGLPGAFLVYTRSADRLIVVDAENLKEDIRFTSVNDSGNNARSNNVLRYTPVDTLAYNTATVNSLSGINSDVRRVGVFANFRSNISAVTWTVQARLVIDPGGVGTVLGPKLDIPGSDITGPEWYFLGELVSPQEISKDIGLRVAASTTTGSPVLDCDTIVVAAMDTAADGAVSLQPFSTALTGSQVWNVRIKHRRLSRPQPATELWASTLSQYVGPVTRGNRHINTRGNQVVVAFLATDGTSWRHLNGDNSAVLTMSLDAIRRPAYLIPE